MESRSRYYQRMKERARTLRGEHGLVTARVTLSDLRKIYKVLGIQLDLWPHFSPRLRGAYFNDPLGPTVAINSNLPNDPRAFTMAHELKHHLEDRPNVTSLSLCSSRNETEVVEIGAEVFAAELLFPEQMFLEFFNGRRCTPDEIVSLKRTTGTTLSYTGLAKRAEFHRLVPKGSLAKVHWKKLEEQIFGVPYYKRRLAARRRS